MSQDESRLKKATSFLLAIVEPALAQNAIGRPSNNRGNPPNGGNFTGQPGMNVGNPNGGNATGNSSNDSLGTNNANNAAAANAVSGFGSGMIVAGIGMILAGLALTGGVIFLALQGQKTSYAGGATRRRKKRRDADD